MKTSQILGLSALALVLSVLNGCAMERGVGDGTSELTARPYFEVFAGSDGRHYFNLHAANHEVILTSQGYSTRTAALSGVLSVLDNGELWNRYEVLAARDGSFYFLLESANGRVIGTSETYGTRSDAERGVEAVVANVGAYLDWQANRTGARYDVFRGMDGRFYFSLHAGNGEIVLRSQGYSTQEAAYNGAFSVAENGVLASRYAIAASADGGFYFNLKAANGAVIGTSETYASRSNAERGRDAVIALTSTLDVL